MTFLFTDIEGSSDLVRTLRERYGDVLDGIEFRDLGERALPSFKSPTRVFELVD